MRDYATKKQQNAAQPAPYSKEPAPGMSNQAMLVFLSTSQKQNVSDEDTIRQKLNEKFNVDFSGLKITKDAALNEIQERAYTKGNEIHLAPDVNLASQEGQQILTHEATHIIQQGSTTLPGGMLHDSSMEAQANDVARGMGNIDTSNFSMPTAEGAPVQGFMDFLFNRRRYNANKASRLIEQSEALNNPEFAQELGKKLSKHGFGGTAIFDPARHGELFRQASGRENGAFRKDHWDEQREITAPKLERELVGLPNEMLNSETGVRKMYGVSQEDLDGMSRIDPAAYRRIIERSNKGANIAASKDWTRMSDSKFLKNYTLLKALSRQSVVAAQASGLVEADADLANNPGENQGLLDEHQDAMNMINPLTSYAEMRLRAIAGSEDHARGAEGFAEGVRGLQKTFRDNHEARTPRRPGLLARLFGRR